MQHWLVELQLVTNFEYFSFKTYCLIRIMKKGTMADMPIQPYAAMLTGSVAGIISTLGFEYLTPLLKKIYLHDTC